MPSGLKLLLPDVAGVPMMLDVNVFEVTPANYAGCPYPLGGYIERDPDVELSVIVPADSMEFQKLMEWRQTVFDPPILSGGHKQDGTLCYLDAAGEVLAERGLMKLWPTQYEFMHGNEHVRVSFTGDFTFTPGDIDFKKDVTVKEKAVIVKALTPMAMRTLNRFGAVLSEDDS
jgi:hypothetical protein